MVVPSPELTAVSWQDGDLLQTLATVKSANCFIVPMSCSSILQIPLIHPIIFLVLMAAESRISSQGAVIGDYPRGGIEIIRLCYAGLHHLRRVYLLVNHIKFIRIYLKTSCISIYKPFFSPVHLCSG